MKTVRVGVATGFYEGTIRPAIRSLEEGDLVMAMVIESDCEPS